MLLLENMSNINIGFNYLLFNKIEFYYNIKISYYYYEDKKRKF